MKILFAVANAVAALVLCGILPHSTAGNWGALGGILWFAVAVSYAVYGIVMWSEKEDEDHINLPEDWDDWNVGDQQWYIHNMNLAGFDFEGKAKELPEVKDDGPMLLSKQEIRAATGSKPPILCPDNALMQSRYAEDWYRARDRELRAKGYTVIESKPNVILPTSWTNQQENKPLGVIPNPEPGFVDWGSSSSPAQDREVLKAQRDLYMEDPATDFSWIKFEKSSGI